MRHPKSYPCVQCYRDTRKHGYTYGLCNDCIQAYVRRLERDKRAMERLAPKRVIRSALTALEGGE